MFEIILLTGLSVAVLSQFLPREQGKSTTGGRHRQRQTKQKSRSGKIGQRQRNETTLLSYASCYNQRDRCVLQRAA